MPTSINIVIPKTTKTTKNENIISELNSLILEHSKESETQSLTISLIPLSYSDEEAQTNYFSLWFKYIIDHYDNLPDFIVFLREDPIPLSTLKHTKELILGLSKTPYMFLDRTFWLNSIKCNRKGLPHHPDLPIESLFKELLPSQPIPEIIEFVSGAQAMKSKKQILQKPLSFYTHIFDGLQKGNINVYALERIFQYF